MEPPIPGPENLQTLSESHDAIFLLGPQLNPIQWNALVSMIATSASLC